MPNAPQIVAVLLLFTSAPPVVTNSQQAPSQPACAASEHRQFDFWIGRWEVKRPDGRVAGTNVIRREHGGCVLIESWTGAGGMTGSSVNAYNPVTKRWHQTWADSSGTLLLIDGEWREGALRLAGEMFGPQGRQQTRITWTPLSGGRLRQMWETSGDEGRTWRTAFDGLYEKLPTGAPQ